MIFMATLEYEMFVFVICQAVTREMHTTSPNPASNGIHPIILLRKRY